MKKRMTFFSLMGYALPVMIGVSAAYGDQGKSNLQSRRKLSPAAIEKREALKKLRLARSGGMIVKPGSMRGVFVVVNTQKEVSVDLVREMLEKMKRSSRLNFRLDNMIGYDGDAKSYMTKSKSSGVVFIVADEKTPSLLVSPDERWSVINVRRLAIRLNEEGKTRFLPGRIMKQVCRAMALMSGSISYFKKSPAAVLSIEDLDECSDMLPIDQVQQLSQYLEKAGMRKLQHVTYRKACQEGWAPAPTNDYQKVIWDEVRQIPQAPIKIKFDPKRDAGK